jgi:hypothetical protein
MGKNGRLILSTSVAFTIVIYLLFSFISLSFNASEWKEVVRVASVITALSSYVFISIWVVTE